MKTLTLPSCSSTYINIMRELSCQLQILTLNIGGPPIELLSLCGCKQKVS